MSAASHSANLVLVAVASLGVSCAPSASESPADYEDDLFSWSDELTPGCEAIERESGLARQALRELEARLGSTPNRAAVVTAESCGGESKITIAVRQSGVPHVRYWLFIFGADGRLVREIGPE